MSGRRMVTVLAHHWLFVSVLTIALVGAAAFVSYGGTRRYEASALMQVQPPVDANGAISLQDTLTARERAVTITALGNTGEVWRRADASLAGLAPFSCSFAQSGQSEFILSTCTSTRRDQVARAANAFAVALQGLLETQRQQRIAELTRQYRQQIQELRKQGVPPQNFPIQDVYPNYREIDVIDRATTPAQPYAPRPLRTILLALALGLVLNSALALLLERVQDRARTIDELRDAIGEPVLATIPPIRRNVRLRPAELTGAGGRPPTLSRTQARLGIREEA